MGCCLHQLNSAPHFGPHRVRVPGWSLLTGGAAGKSSLGGVSLEVWDTVVQPCGWTPPPPACLGLPRQAHMPLGPAARLGRCRPQPSALLDWGQVEALRPAPALVPAQLRHWGCPRPLSSLCDWAPWKCVPSLRGGPPRTRAQPLRRKEGGGHSRSMHLSTSFLDTCFHLNLKKGKSSLR